MGTWDAGTAEWYAAKYGEYPTNRLALDDVDLPADGTVLDIGCGTAAALRHIGTRVARLIGVDPVPRMVQIAAARLAGHPAAGRIELRVGPAEQLPVEDDAVDVVLAFDSYDHWQDQGAGLVEVRRVLKAGGRFIVVKDGGVPNAESKKAAFAAVAEAAGFTVLDAREMRGEGVRFARWILTAG